MARNFVLFFNVVIKIKPSSIVGKMLKC